MALLADRHRRCNVLVFVLPSGFDSAEFAHCDLGRIHNTSGNPVNSGDFCLERRQSGSQNVLTGNRIFRYTINDATVKPMQEAVSVGIQKKTALNALLSSRLAAMKIANEEIATIQDRGQKTLPLTIAIIKLIPVACAWLGLSTHQIVRSSVTVMAAVPLRMALT
jgi:hypothetical protein